jgi:predicted acylesterase/phospholipase RssA
MDPLDMPSTPRNLPPNEPSQLIVQLARLNIAQAFRIFGDAINIGQRQMTELRLKLDAPDVIVRPVVSDIRLLDRIDIAEVTRRGEQAAELALPELRQVVSLPARAARQVRRLVRRG